MAGGGISSGNAMTSPIIKEGHYEPTELANLVAALVELCRACLYLAKKGLPHTALLLAKLAHALSQLASLPCIELPKCLPASTPWTSQLRFFYHVAQVKASIHASGRCLGLSGGCWLSQFQLAGYVGTAHLAQQLQFWFLRATESEETLTSANAPLKMAHALCIDH